MNTVILCPGDCHDPLKNSRGDKSGEDADGGGYTYRIPLFNPIVEFSGLELSSDARKNAIECLKIAIEIEQINLTFRRLGVHVEKWLTDAKPNDPQTFNKTGTSIFWSSEDGKNVSQQIESLRSIALTLALNFHQQRKDEQLAKLASTFGLFKKNEIEAWILDKLPEVVLKELS